jgi:hypothetical protein
MRGRQQRPRVICSYAVSNEDGCPSRCAVLGASGSGCPPERLPALLAGLFFGSFDLVQLQVVFLRQHHIFLAV